MVFGRRKIGVRFWLLVPILVLVGAGVLVRTLRSFIPNVCCVVRDFSGQLELGERVAVYEGEEIAVPSVLLAEEDEIFTVLGVANPSEKWIEVDLSEQRLRAWDGGSLFLETLISTGLPWWPTPTGEFRIWVKLRATRMEGGEGRYYYNLPNVPYVMFFENDKVPSWRGYGLHGTYWHNDFGNVHSHGCVNLPTDKARELYYWTTPVLPEGKSSVFSRPENPGTRIVIHD